MAAPSKKAKPPTRPEDFELTDELAAGIVLLDPLLFRLFFFADDLTEETSAEQKLMMLDESEQVFLCTARKIAKTVHLEACVLQAGCTHSSAGLTEAMFHTPNEVHIKPVIGRLWDRIDRSPFLTLMIRSRSLGEEVALTFALGLRVYFRIEGWTGRDTNMVGLRAAYMWGDEGAFGNFVCHNSRLQTALPHCKTVWAGVPNGVRNTPFYAIDADANPRRWSRWKFDTFINPIYQPGDERAKLAEMYGGVETQGYLNNVLGLWGEETVSSFPPGALAVRDMPYHVRVITAFRSDADLASQLPVRLMVPAIKCDQYAIGWDYGRSPDPSVIIGAYTRGDSVWNAGFRINLVRAMPQPHQLAVARYLLAHLFDGEFLALSCDNQDAIDHLQDKDPERKFRYVWSNPGGAHTTETEEQPTRASGSYEDSTLPQRLRKGSIGNKEHYTILIKEWSLAAVLGMVGVQLWLAAADSELVDELAGTTETKTLHGTAVYLPPVDPNNFGRRPDHNTECLRYTCHAVEHGLALGSADDTEADVLAALSHPWIGAGSREHETAYSPPRTWRAPWER